MGSFSNGPPRHPARRDDDDDDDDDMMMMMPGSACDTPQPKRKKVTEPTEAMRRRLVEHGRSRWTQEQYDSMTQKDLKDNLEELGLKRQRTLTILEKMI